MYAGYFCKCFTLKEKNAHMYNDFMIGYDR